MAITCTSCGPTYGPSHRHHIHRAGDQMDHPCARTWAFVAAGAVGESALARLSETRSRLARGGTAGVAREQPSREPEGALEGERKRRRRRARAACCQGGVANEWRYAPPLRPPAGLRSRPAGAPRRSAAAGPRQGAGRAAGRYPASPTAGAAAGRRRERKARPHLRGCPQDAAERSCAGAKAEGGGVSERFPAERCRNGAPKAPGVRVISYSENEAAPHSAVP